jgi:hypothetical protein
MITLMRSDTFPVLRITAALVCILGGGAAAPVDTTMTPILPQAGAYDTPVAAVITATSASFQAAPVPDQDVDAPSDSSKPDTTISPKLLSPKSLFQGDGYSYASSEQTTLDNRRSAAPGLGLSVPVN